MARPESKDTSAFPHSPLSDNSISQTVKDVKTKKDRQSRRCKYEKFSD